MNCVNCFTNWILAANIILLLSTVPTYIKIAMINMLIALIICGNILIANHGEAIRQYCHTSKFLLHSTNILTHMVLPIIFILMWLAKSTRSTHSKYLSIGLAILISFVAAAIYFILMQLGITFNYTLRQKTINMYILAYVAITFINCFILGQYIK